MTEPIRFYHTNKPFGEFSNFARYPIFLDGQRWPTSEHYFQAQKFLDTANREEVRLARTPMLAATIGRDRQRPRRPDWDSIRDDIMRKAVRAKFTQHEDLRALLLSTGDAELIEHTTNDNYWGDGGDGSGRNMLGRILMEIRTELAAAAGSDVVARG